MVTLAELVNMASHQNEPALVSEGQPLPGGVDPLGLRQINFDLMDRVFPGINNVAVHIRPFTIIAWAWRRAAKVADNRGHASVPLSVLEDFVARVEVVFVWSQFCRHPRCTLPGRDVIASLLQKSAYSFSGAEWERRRDTRKYSTALSAPINYGPAVKAFGWLQTGDGGAFATTEMVQNAMTALDNAMAPYLDHPAFSELGAVTVTGAEVSSWAEAWALDQPTEEEKIVMITALTGDGAPKCRREGIKLVLAAASYLGTDVSEQGVRRVMCGTPSNFLPPEELEPIAEAWRIMQVRQVFRLALETLFFWLCRRLDPTSPASTGELVADFLKVAGNAATAGEWLSEVRREECGPVEWLEMLHDGLAEGEQLDQLPALIRGALAACIEEAPNTVGAERNDRLPLARAAAEVNGWCAQKTEDFLAHVVDGWVFGQHVYWSVGRGLADARSHGKSILRLKVAVEEGGWTTMPGAQLSAPRATEDRLGSMIGLMRESGLLKL